MNASTSSRVGISCAHARLGEISLDAFSTLNKRVRWGLCWLQKSTRCEVLNRFARGLSVEKSFRTKL
jgi:hypothetical protein